MRARVICLCCYYCFRLLGAVRILLRYFARPLCGLTTFCQRVHNGAYKHSHCLVEGVANGP